VLLRSTSVGALGTIILLRRSAGSRTGDRTRRVPVAVTQSRSHLFTKPAIRCRTSEVVTLAPS
jgi:hypothetical protein